MTDPTNKYALITGASSGIGWQISLELAKRGYSIIAVSNQSEKLLKLKTELESNQQIDVITLDHDLSKIDSAEYIFDFCKNKNLTVEVLVNNAGFLIVNEVVNTDIRKTKDIVQLHMQTPVLLCRLFGEVMAKNQKGFILNVSSIAASMPYPIISLYGPTKTFLRQFTKAFRVEMKEKNVGVTCLLPGATATALYDEENFNIPLGIKLGVVEKPEFVARAGINAMLKGKAECVPGILNKFIMLILPLIPGFVIGFIYKNSSLKKKLMTKNTPSSFSL